MYALGIVIGNARSLARSLTVASDERFAWFVGGVGHGGVEDGVIEDHLEAPPCKTHTIYVYRLSIYIAIL